MNKPAKAAAEVKVAPEPKASPRRAEEPPSPSIPARSQRSSRRPMAILLRPRTAQGRPRPLRDSCHVAGSGRGPRAVRPGRRLLCELKRVDPSGFFCGRVSSVHRPYYKLEIAWPRETRVEWDPYSFGLVLASDDFSAVEDIGTSRFYMSSARTWSSTATSRAAALSSGHLTPTMSASLATSTSGTAGAIRCACGTRPASGNVRSRAAAGAAVQIRNARSFRRLLPLKADPVAFRAEHPPATASVLHGRPEIPEWHDEGWIEGPRCAAAAKAPISIYECHLGSWARVPEEGNRYLSYREFGERLIPYVRDLGFTHIELLPITEYPFDGSWGYQPISLYAPTCRFGTPEDFAAFVESAHAAGIGVLLDWVPAHFPNDPHGLARFDGTHLYEHADPRQGFHQDWGTHIYNFGRREVMASSSRMRASGSSAIISTDCASMPSPRCSISIIRASRANGCRTATAATRISKRSTSFAA